jgi:hypothetical protein
MPDEAFGWFVGWASGVMIQYPDGLGGFQNDSRQGELNVSTNHCRSHSHSCCSSSLGYYRETS